MHCSTEAAGDAYSNGKTGSIRPLRNEPAYLRRKAKELRDLADRYRTPLSAQLRQMADEFEKHARELEELAGE